MMKILFISHRVPYPPNKGDKIRAFQLLKSLKALGHEVTSAFPIEHCEDLHYADALNQLCDRIICPEHKESQFKIYTNIPKGLIQGKSFTELLGFSSSLYHKLSQDNTVYDLVIFYSAISTCYQSAVIYQKSLCDFVDMDSLKWQEYANQSDFLHGWIYQREAQIIGALERKIASEVDYNLFVTQQEGDLFKEHITIHHDKIAPIGYLEHAIDCDYYDPRQSYCDPRLSQHQDHLILVMTGAMDYRPNYEGAVFFIDHIFKKLQAALSEKIAFYCVGRSAVSALKGRHNPEQGVVITGTVPDVRPYLYHADVAVAPLSIGRGIQNKVLEAMMMARCCVISPEAYCGVDAIADTHLMVCQQPHEWVDCLKDMLQNPTKRNQIGQAAHQYIKNRYSVEYMYKKLNEIMDKIVSYQ